MSSLLARCSLLLLVASCGGWHVRAVPPRPLAPRTAPLRPHQPVLMSAAAAGHAHDHGHNNLLPGGPESLLERAVQPLRRLVAMVRQLLRSALRRLRELLDAADGRHGPLFATYV